MIIKIAGCSLSYGCSRDKNVRSEGCVKETIKNYSGEVIREIEKCVCTGDLCNSASIKGVNFIMALACFLITYFRFFV